MLKINDGHYDYKSNEPLLKNINLTIESSGVLAILGPNGVGKTTLLKCMVGLLNWSMGNSYILGKNINSYSQVELWRIVSFVPQVRGVIFSYTVEEMILMGRSSNIGIFSTPSKYDYEIMNNIIDKIGINYLRKKKCNKISGGELQLVLIARALCAEPRILILDEPESNLDFRNQLIILDIIRNLADNGILCIFNTHYPTHAINIAENTLVLSKNEEVYFGDSVNILRKDIIDSVFNVEVDIKSLSYNNKNYKNIAAISLK